MELNWIQTIVDVVVAGSVLYTVLSLGVWVFKKNAQKDQQP